MEKEWKVFQNYDCPICGSQIEVLTECLESNDNEFEEFFTDGDEARCASECGFISAISVSDGEAWIQDGNMDELLNQ